MGPGVRTWRRRPTGGAGGARRETDTTLAAYVVARLAEGWTPEQIAGWLKRGIERGLRAVCAETIYAWLYRAGQAGQKLWRMRASITFDNDTCFARHAVLRTWLSATTYFCDAYASWQKGGIENTNGRIRRWLPRGADLDAIDERDIQEIAMTLNLTPRKCLGFLTPLEAYAKEFGKRIHHRFA